MDNKNPISLLQSLLSLGFDPRDPEIVFLGTTAGLFQNSQFLARPPSTLHVAAVALHPQNPDILFMATRPFINDSVRIFLSGRGLYRRHLEDGRMVWEDLSPNLPGQVQEIGFDLQTPNRLYIRTAEQQVYRQTFPAQLRPEDFGWESVQTMPRQVPLDPPGVDPASFLRVSPLYANVLVSRPLEVHWGFLYAWTTNRWLDRRITCLSRSRDGGFSWEGVGGCYESIYDQIQGRVMVLYESRGQARVWPGLPDIAADANGPWTYDPLDPTTLYVAQWGRGLLYRSHDLENWEEVSQGLDPMFVISKVVVDSSGTIYLRTDKGIWRKQNPPRPFRLAEARLWLDTLSVGTSFRVSARPVSQTDGRGHFTGTLSAEVNGQSYPLVDQGDGVFVAQIKLGQEQPLGFDWMTLVLEPPNQPQARISQQRRFMVVPPEDVLVYGDGIDPKWEFRADEGSMDLAATKAYTGKSALQFEGRMTCQYLGTPIHPFGYVLEFYVAATDTSAVNSLTINEQPVDSLASLRQTEGSWTRIEIPAEKLNNQPEVRQPAGAFPYLVPAYITELRFRSPVPIYLGEIQLRTSLSLALPPTLVAETRDAVLPQYFHLDPNFPNPFNPTTTIRFALPASAQTELTLYNLAGQKVATLLSGLREAGTYALQWDGRDDQGRSLATGVYFYRLQADSQVEARKLLLLR